MFRRSVTLEIETLEGKVYGCDGELICTEVRPTAWGRKSPTSLW